MEGKFGEKVWLVAQKDCHLFSIDRKMNSTAATKAHPSKQKPAKARTDFELKPQLSSKARQSKAREGKERQSIPVTVIPFVRITVLTLLP